MDAELIYRVAEIRTIEAQAAGQPLMERAGLAAAAVAREMLAGRRSRALVLVGPGNNGGDALIVARHLSSWFFEVVVCGRERANRASPDAETALAAWRACGGVVRPDWDGGDRDYGLIVDGILGIGLRHPIGDDYARWIEQTNASRIPVLALDVPSGLDADTGVAQANTIRASATATFIALKPGLLTLDGPEHCGSISVHSLDLGPATTLLSGSRIDWNTLRAALPNVLRRTRRNVHKGTFGTLGIVGGSEGLGGAALLAA